MVLTRVSVVIPCYNTEVYIAQAIRSVLNQAQCDFEIVVVNDGSTDSSAEIVQQFTSADHRVRLVEQENQGLSAARNTGFRESKGEYIHFLDADDELLPGALSSLTRCLDENKEYAVAVGGWQLIDETGKLLAQEKPKSGEIRGDHLLERNRLPVHAALHRRTNFEQAGLFDTSLKSAEDWEVYCRMVLQGLRFLRIPELVCAYRVTPGSMSSHARRQTENTLLVIEKTYSSGAEDKLSDELHRLAKWQAYTSGAMRAFQAGDLELGSEYVDKALELNPPQNRNEEIAWVHRFLQRTRIVPPDAIDQYVQLLAKACAPHLPEIAGNINFLRFMAQKERFFACRDIGNLAGALRSLFVIMLFHPVTALGYTMNQLKKNV